MLRRCSRALACLAAVTIGVIVIAQAAHAQVTGELAWSAPPGCPDLAQAERRLSNLIGDDRAATRGHAEVAIDHAPTGELRARVVLIREGRREQRELFGHACDALSDAALLVIGLGLEGAPAHFRTTEQTGLGPSKPSAPLLRAPNTDERAGPALRSRLVLALSSMVAIDTGVLPALALGAGGGLVLRRARTRLELDATFYLPQTLEAVAGSAHGRATFGLTVVAARACYTASRPESAARLAFFPCAGVELGQARGRGDQLGDSHDMRAVWSALLLGLGASLGPYHRLAPVARIELGLPYRRPSFDLTNGQQVFQAPSVLARFTLRVELDLL